MRSRALEAGDRQRVHGSVLLELAERKLRLFPDDPREVLSWNVKEIHDGFHVTAEAGPMDLA